MSSKYIKTCLQPEHYPRLHLGSLPWSPDPVAGFSEGSEREEMRKEDRKGKRKEWRMQGTNGREEETEVEEREEEGERMEKKQRGGEEGGRREFPTFTVDLETEASRPPVPNLE